MQCSLATFQTDLTLVLDIDTMTWTYFRNTQTPPRGGQCVVHLENDIYLMIGGQASPGNVMQDLVDVFDWNTQTWLPNYPVLPQPIYDHACVRYTRPNGEITIVIAGGIVGPPNVLQDKVFILNRATDTFETQTTRLPHPIAYIPTVLYDKWLFLFSGQYSPVSNRIVRYDLEAGTVEILPTTMEDVHWAQPAFTYDKKTTITRSKSTNFAIMSI